jgi:MFS family permease
MIANTAPTDLRGTAYGFFNLMSGITLLVASVLAGLIWDQFGASFTFIVGGVFCILTLLAIAYFRRVISI